ncbi:MAG: hypothetical protein FWG72_09160 [Oscillospiraceae bacterium]|nr:hypothetical protein [Oscillospiraceae bacterium]
MNGRGKTSLFLMELLIAITVFAVCAAVCTAIFTDAFLTAKDAGDLNYALIAAKNGAETYKTVKSPEETAAVLGGGALGPGSAAVYYDGSWQVCGEPDAAYVLRLNAGLSAAPPFLCALSVEKITGEEIIAFTVAAGGGSAR